MHNHGPDHSEFRSAEPFDIAIFGDTTNNEATLGIEEFIAAVADALAPATIIRTVLALRYRARAIVSASLPVASRSAAAIVILRSRT
jgi:hypothetical protein